MNPKNQPQRDTRKARRSASGWETPTVQRVGTFGSLMRGASGTHVDPNPVGGAHRK
jgi:hypothetical protein